MAQVQVANSLRSPSVESLLSRGQSTPTSSVSDTSPATPADLEGMMGKGNVKSAVLSLINR